MRMIILVVTVTLAFVACTTTGQIAAGDSMIVVDLPATSLPDIDRTRRWDGQDLVEDWSWENGQLYIVRYNRTQFMNEDFDDPEDLVAQAEKWRTFRGAGTTFNIRDVRTSTNAIGPFLYAVSNVDMRGDRCFMMIQGLRASTGASFDPISTSDISQGAVSLYECRRDSPSTAEELEDSLLVFAEALIHVQR